MSESNVIRPFGDIAPVVDAGPVDVVPEQNKEKREQIRELEQSIHENIESGDVDERDPPVRHYFSKGVYCREMFISKGTLVIGKIHKTAHLNIISMGCVSVTTQYGSDNLSAPHTFKSEIGTQRAVYAHEDTVWTTIHPTELTDVDEIEEQIIAKSFSEIDKLLIEAGEQMKTIEQVIIEEGNQS